MAAPEGIEWGSIYGSGTHRGRLGCYKSISSSGATTTVDIEIWFWTEYDCYDENNTLYYNVGQDVTAATTSQGAVSISNSATSQWNTSNQKKILTKSHSYTRGTSARTYNVHAKLTDIEYIGKTVYINDTFNVPALPSYSVKYNANGGSGAPGAQTKWYGKALTLSSTVPTRTGYTFKGWGTSASDTSVDYAAGASYTANSGTTLYAIWQAKTYKVTYNANGGTGEPAAQNKTHGTNLTLSSTKPTRANYTFLGWGTSATTSVVSYAAGASYSKNAAITLYAVWGNAYTKPKIKNFSVGRCGSSGTADAEGGYALVKFTWSTSVAASSIKIDWKKSTSSKYSTPVTVTASGTSGTVSQVIGAGGLEPESSYTIRVTVVDGTDSNYATRMLPGTLFPLDILYNGKGLGIGKAAELQDYLDVAFDARFRKNLYTGEKQANSDGKQGCLLDDEGFIHLQRETAKGYFPYLAFYLDAETTAAGTLALETSDTIRIMKVKGADDFQIAPASGGTCIPYYRKGNSVTLDTIVCSGYVAESTTNVFFFIPFAKPIVGAPTIAIASGSGMRLRQNGNYTHGSANGNVTPSSYTIDGYYNFGIRVKAVFSSSTNATKNSPIGITFSGTITFS